MFTKTLNNSCTIYRPVEILGSYNTPTGFQEQEIGYYPCRLSRKSLITAQKNPQTETSETYNLFLNPNINIQVGDIILINSEKYRAGIPYELNHHHIEVEITKVGDA